MTAKSVFATVAGFLTHHVTDLNAVVHAVSSIANALPLNAGDKAHIQEALDRLASSATNIEAALASLTGADAPADPATEVHISEADIETAVKAVLPDVLKALGYGAAGENVTAPATDAGAGKKSGNA